MLHIAVISLWGDTTGLPGAFAWLCTSLVVIILVLLAECFLAIRREGREEDIWQRSHGYAFVLLPMCIMGCTGLILYGHLTHDERSQARAQIFLGLCISYLVLCVPWFAAVLAIHEDWAYTWHCQAYTPVFFWCTFTNFDFCIVLYTFHLWELGYLKSAMDSIKVPRKFPLLPHFVSIFITRAQLHLR